MTNKKEFLREVKLWGDSKGLIIPAKICKALDLKEIHDKYFDKSGMKQKGKDIVKEGLKGLKK